MTVFEVCRLCLRYIKDNSDILIDSYVLEPGDICLKDALTICMPEISLEKTIQRHICNACLLKITSTYRVKCEVLKTEDKIIKYFTDNKLPDNVKIDLTYLDELQQLEIDAKEREKIEIEKIKAERLAKINKMRLMKDIVYKCFVCEYETSDYDFLTNHYTKRHNKTIEIIIEDVGESSVKNEEHPCNSNSSSRRHSEIFIPIQRTENVTTSQRTENVTTSQRTENANPSQHTENSFSVQHTENLTSTQHTQNVISSQHKDSANNSLIKCTHPNCEYSAATLSLLEEHKVSHKKYITCNKCGASFTGIRYMLVHSKRIHKGELPSIKCRICSYTTSNENKAKSHLHNKHKDVVLWNSTDGTGDIKRGTRRSDMIKKPKFGNIVKTKVNSGSSSIQSGAKKQKLGNGINSLLPKKAPESETQERSSPDPKHITVKVFSCKVAGCCFKTSLRVKLLKHQTNHKISRKILCCICQMKFQNMKLLDAHSNSEHRDCVLIKCCFCAFSASSKKLLAGHYVKEHHKETYKGTQFRFNECNLLKCCYCAYSTSSKNFLTAHYDTKHPSETVDADEAGSESVFHRKENEGDLSTDEVCEICGLRTSKNSMETHKKVHLERPFVCIKCDSAFSERKLLVTHIINHNKPLKKKTNCKQSKKANEGREKQQITNQTDRKNSTTHEKESSGQEKTDNPKNQSMKNSVEETHKKNKEPQRGRKRASINEEHPSSHEETSLGNKENNQRSQEDYSNNDKEKRQRFKEDYSNNDEENNQRPKNDYSNRDKEKRRRSREDFSINDKDTNQSSKEDSFNNDKSNIQITKEEENLDTDQLTDNEEYVNALDLMIVDEVNKVNSTMLLDVDPPVMEDPFAPMDEDENGRFSLPVLNIKSKLESLREDLEKESVKSEIITLSD